MNKRRQKRKTIGTILELIGILSWFLMPAAIIFYSYLSNNRPTSPENAMCVEICNHGRLFYITPSESIIFSCLFFGGGIGFAVLTVLGAFIQGKEPFKEGLDLPISSELKNKAKKIIFKVATLILFLLLCFLLWIWISLIRLGA